MRRPVTIERSKAGLLWVHVLRRSEWLDVCQGVVRGADKLAMLSKHASTVIRHVLADCLAADAELGFGPEPAEQDARNYLASLA